MNDNILKLKSKLKERDILICDLDGTLANTESLHWQAYNILLKKDYSIELDILHILKYIGLTENLIYDLIEKDYCIKIKNRDMFLANRLDIFLKLVKEKSLKRNKWVDEILDKLTESRCLILSSQIPFVANKIIGYLNLENIFNPTDRVYVFGKNFTKEEVLRSPQTYFRDILANEVELSHRIAVFEDAQKYCNVAKRCDYLVVGIEHEYNKGALEDCDIIIY